MNSRTVCQVMVSGKVNITVPSGPPVSSKYFGNYHFFCHRLSNNKWEIHLFFLVFGVKCFLWHKRSYTYFYLVFQFDSQYSNDEFEINLKYLAMCAIILCKFRSWHSIVPFYEMNFMNMQCISALHFILTTAHVEYSCVKCVWMHMHTSMCADMQMVNSNSNIHVVRIALSAHYMSKI